MPALVARESMRPLARSEPRGGLGAARRGGARWCASCARRRVLLVTVELRAFDRG